MSSRLRRFGWIGRHPLRTVAAIALAVGLACGLEWWFLPNHPILDAGRVESVKISLRKYNLDPTRPGFEQDAAEITFDDPVRIQQLLDVFRSATRAEEHNCGDSGTIAIRRTDGTIDEVEILPGHDEQYYEYRLGSRINRVPREPFMTALAAVGLTRVKTVPP